MNYNTDRPIMNCDQDLIGRSSFAKQLSKAIYEYNNVDGLVIGLYGKWGTGKTSLINMTLKELDDLSSNEDNKPIVMRFSPWNYSDNNNLISSFFYNLISAIEYQDNDNFKKKIGELLNDYSDLIDVLSYVPFVGAGLTTALKTVVREQGKNLSKERNLDETRAELETALRDANKKLLL